MTKTKILAQAKRIREKAKKEATVGTYAEIGELFRNYANEDKMISFNDALRILEPHLLSSHAQSKKLVKRTMNELLDSFIDYTENVLS